MRLDHLGEQPLGLVELFDLQVGGAEEEGELRILRVGRTRRLERLHRFLQLPVGHERLCEQALQRPVLLVTAGDAGEDVDCVRRPTASAGRRRRAPAVRRRLRRWRAKRDRMRAARRPSSLRSREVDRASSTRRRLPFDTGFRPAAAPPRAGSLRPRQRSDRARREVRRWSVRAPISALLTPHGSCACACAGGGITIIDTTATPNKTLWRRPCTTADSSAAPIANTATSGGSRERSGPDRLAGKPGRRRVSHEELEGRRVPRPFAALRERQPDSQDRAVPAGIDGARGGPVFDCLRWTPLFQA